MKLQRLVIQGFKSFKDRTIINFDDGITGIVGPNGCGKSNIVDALFWVMGEQSAKHLRGNSMRDVIFAGSSKYSPGSFAEATLVLENTAGRHIHIGNKVANPTEIQLTRKLYRNGDSEYRINNQPCRLKDVQEVFMDTGAGAKSYSIIAQGEINRLVQAKPQERRVMIEEVAGITKFKARKKESLRKIEQTESNLSRLQDLQSEIEKNLKKLQKQSEKADRARSLKAKIKKNDLLVQSHKAFDALKSFRDYNKTISEEGVNLENWKKEKEDLEVSLKEERSTKKEKSKKLDELQKSYNNESRDLAASKERFSHLTKSRTEKEKLIEEKKSDIENLEKDILEREEKLKALKTTCEELRAQSFENVDFELLEHNLEELLNQKQSREDSLSSNKLELEKSKKELFEVEQTIVQNNSKLTEYSNGLEDITKEIEALETQFSGVSRNIVEERSKVANLEKSFSELVSKEASTKIELESLREEKNKAEREFKEISKNLIHTESKLSSLHEINNSLDGIKEGTSQFLKENDDNCTLLGNIIECEPQFEKSVQNLLSDFFNTLVLNGKHTDLGEWINKSQEGIDILFEDESDFSDETAQRLELNGLSGVRPLADILKIDSKYLPKLEKMLKGYFIVPNLNVDKVIELPKGIKFKAIADEKGKLWVENIGGAKFLRVANKTQGMGIVERNNLISELEQQQSQFKVKEEELEALVEKTHQDFNDMMASLESVREASSEAKAMHAAEKSAFESRLSHMEVNESRLGILSNRKLSISKQKFDLVENEESWLKKSDVLKDSIENLASSISESEEDFKETSLKYNDHKEELMQKKMELNSFEDRIKGFSSQVEDIEKQIEKTNSKINLSNESFSNYSQEVEQLSASIKDLETHNSEKEESLKAEQLVLKEEKNQLEKITKAMMDRENRAKKLSVLMHKAEKDVSVSLSKVEQILKDEEEVSKNVFEKYQINLRDSIGNFLEYKEDEFGKLNDISSMFMMEAEDGPRKIIAESFEFVRKYGNDLKECQYRLRESKKEYNRLGEINWQAIEDYDRQKIRFTFLKDQEEELKASLEDLEQAINHIDEKSKERFKIAFEEVGMRFEKVFPIIFGGGSARLKVTGSLNDSECGIDIIAQPPGKKMQNINLMSGGEKALTAVSLIFSIFLVKPSPFCLLDEVDAPLDDANVGRFNELLREMSSESQFILITHNKKTMELNDTLYGVTMQEPGVSKAISVQLQ